MLSGIIIVGGKTSNFEIFNPKTRRTCSVKPKRPRPGLTMCNNMVCGGYGPRHRKTSQTQKSCEKFDGKASFTSLPVKLVKDRSWHLCWGLKSGDVLLLGGKYSKKTTERVSSNGSSSTLDFHLAYSTE